MMKKSEKLKKYIFPVPEMTLPEIKSAIIFSLPKGLF